VGDENDRNRILQLNDQCFAKNQETDQ
jgi:hypothetical protein